MLAIITPEFIAFLFWWSYDAGRDKTFFLPPNCKVNVNIAADIFGSRLGRLNIPLQGTTDIVKFKFLTEYLFVRNKPITA